MILVLCTLPPSRGAPWDFSTDRCSVSVLFFFSRYPDLGFLVKRGVLSSGVEEHDTTLEKKWCASASIVVARLLENCYLKGASHDPAHGTRGLHVREPVFSLLRSATTPPEKKLDGSGISMCIFDEVIRSDSII